MTSREVFRALQLGKISIEDAKRSLTIGESPMDTDTGTSQASALDKLHIAIDRVSADRGQPCPPSSGSRKDIGSSRLPGGKV